MDDYISLIASAHVHNTIIHPGYWLLGFVGADFESHLDKLVSLHTLMFQGPIIVHLSGDA
jgi:hypothetical protein